MNKDEALKVSVKLLHKLIGDDTVDVDIIACQSYILTAEANKNYGKIYAALEELKHFINKLQIKLKEK